MLFLHLLASALCNTTTNGSLSTLWSHFGMKHESSEVIEEALRYDL